jgi:hypothetical protein
LVNAHLDSPIGDTEERAHQLDLCSRLLTLPTDQTDSVLQIMCGDFNIFSTNELSRVIPSPFQDSIVFSKLNPAVENPESATLGITFATAEEKRLYPPRRSDFVFWYGEKWKGVKHENKGRECVMDESGKFIKCPRGVDGHLHASDHLAVLVEFEVIRAREK